ncbi:MAG TPA: hypothetical protein VG055_12170 [Planctomycetaceae bacterium]|jgi:hypothetical protein|nr:hypothetical protein [Planctomycetaceae bacterium]
MFVVGLSAPIAKAADEPTATPSKSSTVRPDKDVRLACLTNAKPQKIGVLTYYQNAGGGYTFLEGKEIAFYALPYLPTTYQRVQTRLVTVNRNGLIEDTAIAETVNVFTVGKSKMPFGGQTLYRPGIPDTFRPEHIPIAIRTRATPDGDFSLSIMDEDHKTRLRLKSISPVLERAPKPLPSKP